MFCVYLLMYILCLEVIKAHFVSIYLCTICVYFFKYMTCSQRSQNMSDHLACLTNTGFGRTRIANFFSIILCDLDNLSAKQIYI